MGITICKGCCGREAFSIRPVIHPVQLKDVTPHPPPPTTATHSPHSSSSPTQHVSSSVDTGRYSIFLLFLQSCKRRKHTQPPDFIFLLFLQNRKQRKHTQPPVFYRCVCLLLKTSSSSSSLEDLIIIIILSEKLVEEALELIVFGYGKKWNGEGAHKRLGKRPLELAASLIHDYSPPTAIATHSHLSSSSPTQPISSSTDIGRYSVFLLFLQSCKRRKRTQPLEFLFPFCFCKATNERSAPNHQTFFFFYFCKATNEGSAPNHQILFFLDGYVCC